MTGEFFVQQVDFNLIMKTYSKITGNFLVVGLAIFWAAQNICLAYQLSSAPWVVQSVPQMFIQPPSGLRVSEQTSTENGQVQPASSGSSVNVSAVLDGNPNTYVTLTNLAAFTQAPSLLINLSQTCAIDRVVICGTSNGLIMWANSQSSASQLPLGLVNVYVGNTPQSMSIAGSYAIPYDAGNPISQPMDIRFSPAVGQYVKLELQTRVNWPNCGFGGNVWFGWGNVTNPVDQRWQISEVELYGTPNTVATNAVVLEANAPYALSLAAGDLSYYLTELTGQPHPIIAPSQTNLYSGNLYTVQDLAYLAPDYPTMMANIASGLLPTNEVNITVNGRVITFTGWPYRCVDWSVWEFLERQGVHWVYPDVHGDYVPSTGVNLGMLPLKMSSSSKMIYANWNSGLFQPWPAWVQQSPQQSWLYIWRNRWTSAWSSGPWGNEMPYIKSTGTIAPQFAEGFTGYPHNMSSVMPLRILTNNPSWWGSADGTNYNPYSVQFDLASPGADAWVAQKVLAWDAVYHGPSQSVQSLSPDDFDNAYNILPVDAVTFSVDTNTLLADQIYGGSISGLPWVWGWHPSSGAYYKLLSSVANAATNQLIGGLAYADVFDPPASNYPANVQMEVCLYGSPNLPFTSTPNAGMKAALDTWHQRCSKLAVYDYSLLFSDVWQTDQRLPVPMVSAYVDNARYLAGIGALRGGVQATETSLQFNPWDFYAWPRVRWNTNLTSSQILTNFFTGYYREAAAPMLAYYQAMENYQYSNGIDLHFHGYCYNISPGSFPLSVLNQMETNLQYATSLATNWYVLNRIHDATNALGWVMSQSGLTNMSMLSNYSIYNAVPATGTYSVILTNFSPYTVYGTGAYSTPVWNENAENGWDFDGAAVVKQTLNFTQPGNYRVDTVCRCKWSSGNYPTLRVILGPSSSATISTAPKIRSSTFVTNSCVLSIPYAAPFDLIIAQDQQGQFLCITNVQLTKQ